jgi:hypothetical protein
MSSALRNLLALDLSRILAGPWAGQLLADLGAEVIKVERPGAGDDTRGWGPPFVRDSQGRDSDAAYFMCANRNKKRSPTAAHRRRWARTRAKCCSSAWGWSQAMSTRCGRAASSDTRPGKSPR